jgi:hypothetical protein
MKNLKTHHWLILGGVVIAGYLIYKNNSKSSATVASSKATPAAGTSSFTGGPMNFTGGPMNADGTGMHHKKNYRK